MYHILLGASCRLGLALSPRDQHGQAVPGSQNEKGIRLDGLSGRQSPPVALGNDCQNQYHLHECEFLAQAAPRRQAKRQIGGIAALVDPARVSATSAGRGEH